MAFFARDDLGKTLFFQRAHTVLKSVAKRALISPPNEISSLKAVEYYFLMIT